MPGSCTKYASYRSYNIPGINQGDTVDEYFTNSTHVDYKACLGNINYFCLF
ncbi:17593_t:CDS:2 [Dentiscutata erythropus]|uniref:17593_t:CDS:1 n=1 Tax=Dentiscutata erythropus TaxID=1348616 RepID=A0A9N8VX65_9GLOM|nr:17593_t:CDS:2 [Dentiscutata erythropus]